MDGCSGARRPLWMAVGELGGHCGWLLGSSEAIVDGCSGARRPLWMAVGELGGHCGWL